MSAGAASAAGPSAGEPARRRICVFCGSSDDVAPRYLDGARAVGRAIARRGLGVVYGGGRVGLMGALADAALAEGGEVLGVIPVRLLEREVGHRGVTELVVVPGMHERKRRMAELADAFLALPGGLGTLEELFEVATWALLGYHRKPIAVLDADGYFDDLFAFLDRAAREGFVRPADRAIIARARAIDDALDRLVPVWPPEPGDRGAMMVGL